MHKYIPASVNLNEFNDITHSIWFFNNIFCQFLSANFKLSKCTNNNSKQELPLSFVDLFHEL
jgi:hypothetical protein